MGIRKFVLMFISLSFCASAHATPQGLSMCSVDETILFSCSVKKKIASICATKDLSTNTGYVYYRFGSLNKAPELTYPSENIRPAEAFFAFFSAYAKGNSAQLSFTVDDTTYIVYSEHNVFDENGSGVAIERNSKRIAHLRCNANVQHELFILKTLGLPKAEFRTLP